MSETGFDIMSKMISELPLGVGYRKGPDLLDQDTDDYEYQQGISLAAADDSDYDDTPLSRSYNEGDETKELFEGFWYAKSPLSRVDPARYEGTHLEWSSLEEYRARNPKDSP